jgi:hypothetical protein
MRAPTREPCVLDHRTAIGIVNRDITECKRAEEILNHSEFYDGLMDLPNRTLFADRLQHALSRSRRHSDYEFAVLLVDIDEFKVLNDSSGVRLGTNCSSKLHKGWLLVFEIPTLFHVPRNLIRRRVATKNTSGSARRKCGTCWLENDCMAESLQALYLSSGSSETLRLSN